jgi:molecular chaperone IbpA
MQTWKFDHTFADLAKFDKYFVGVDQLRQRLTDIANTTAEVVSKYPPYNIKKLEDNKYVIEMAVAGFGKQDIELTLEGGKLTVSGHLTSSEDTLSYIWKGISDRAFTREFTLADNVEIKNADLLNGMLKIWLEAIIPESKKPKKIPINDEPSEVTPEPELLTEKNKKG